MTSTSYSTTTFTFKPQMPIFVTKHSSRLYYYYCCCQYHFLFDSNIEGTRQHNQSKKKKNIYIYKSRDLMLESMKLCYIAHSLKFPLFSFLLQQNLYLY